MDVVSAVEKLGARRRMLRHGVPPDDARHAVRSVVAKDTVFSRDEARE